MTNGKIDLLVNAVSRKVHRAFVMDRRDRILAWHIQSLLPEAGTVLDVGCGTGKLSRLVQEIKPGIMIQGIDILERQESHIPVDIYDGKKIPFANESFDFVMFIDVLHHTVDPFSLIHEANRVSSKFLVIKDHLSDGWLGCKILTLMDWVGNRHEGVSLPYNYYSSNQWLDVWRRIGAYPDKSIVRLNLYPFPFNTLFERSLHFIVRVPKSN